MSLKKTAHSNCLNNSEVMKAVIYARYSSHAQREESIEGQLRICYEYAAREHIDVIDKYIDRAISGTTDDRPAFQRMIADSAKHQFEAVILYAVDRFARDRYASATYKHELKKHGVKILSATQPLDDSPESILLESMLEGLAEYYSANLARGVKRGMRENAYKCQAVGGPGILGYTVDPATKKDVIDPGGSKVVQEIFSRYSSGDTLAAIVDYCNENGYLTSKGKPFSRNSLTTILRNRRYLGWYIYDDIEIEGGMPVIVDEKTYRSVQMRLDHNKISKAGSKSDVDFYLTGKLICGHCLQPMCGTSGRSANGEKYYYYSCRCHGNKCSKRNERKEFIEDAIFDYLSSSFLSDENIERIADECAKMNQGEGKAKVIESLKAEKAAVHRQKMNVFKMIANGNDDPDLAELVNDLRDQEDRLGLQISKAELERSVITKDMIIFWLEQFKAGSEDTITSRKHLINGLVSSIHLYDINKNQSDPECSDGGLYGLGVKAVITFNTAEPHEKTVVLDCSDYDGMVVHSSIHPNFYTKYGHFYILHRGSVLVAVINL